MANVDYLVKGGKRMSNSGGVGGRNYEHTGEGGKGHRVFPRTMHLLIGMHRS